MVVLDEILSLAVNNGIICGDDVREIVEMKQRQHYLSQHESRIYQGKDGYWYTCLPDGKSGRKKDKKKERIDLEKTVAAYYKLLETSPTIREVFEEWNNRRLESGAIERSTYWRNGCTFKRHFGNGFGERRIETVSALEWSEFLENEVNRLNMKQRAWGNLKALVRGILKRAKRTGKISFNVEEFMADLDVSGCRFNHDHTPGSETVFNEDEYPVVMSYVRDNPDIQNLGIALLLVSGLRVGELTTLKFSDFSSPCLFHVCRTETFYKDESGKFVYAVKDKPKTAAGVRTVVLPSGYEWIYESIKKLNPDGEYLLTKNGKRLGCQSIRSRLYRVCEKLGFSYKSPHDIRRTYASILLDSHVDNNFVIAQMGHTDVSCTENYYHKDRKSIVSKSEIVNNISAFVQAV